MGNCQATCCGAEAGELTTRNLTNSDLNDKEYMKRLTKNIHLVIKVQAWARGNKCRKQIAKQMNDMDMKMRSQGYTHDNMQPQQWADNMQHQQQ